MSDANIVVGEITSTEDLWMMDKAKEVGDALNDKYPGHLWAVSWQGGALVVKNLAISSFYGFTIKPESDLKHNAMIAGGELLERARMRRSGWDGSMAETLEGSDPRFFRNLN